MNKNFLPLSGLASEIDTIINHFMNENLPQASAGFMPHADIVESNDHYVLTLELAGCKPEAVNVEVKDGRLLVYGEKHSIPIVEGERLICNQRRSGSFSRAFEFGEQVDFEKIAAGYTDGLLTIQIPKSEKSKPRKIKVDFMNN